jgi:hypothetical protein
MDIPDCVPSLAELIETEYQGNQCCWHNLKNGNKNLKRCGNIIRGRDAKERDSLIDDLRALIRTAADTATLSPTTFDGLPEIHEKFEKVSMWLLCKGKHRSESRKIVQKWSNELDRVKEARDSPSTINIRKELNIQDCEKVFCHGKKVDGARCAKPISRQNRDCANLIIAALAEDRVVSSSTKENIIVLAKLLMCQGYHQGQAPQKSEEWFNKIQKLLAETDAVPEQASSPQQPSAPQQTPTSTYSRTATVDSEKSESAASSVFSKADSIATSKPMTSPPSRRRHSHGATASGSPLRLKRPTQTTTIDNGVPQPLGHTRITRNSTFVMPKEPAVPKFKPFPPKSIKAVMERIYERIKRPIIPREEDTGHIYAYQRDGDSLIKVGYTSKMGLESRIKSWNKQCKQEVRVVLQEYLPHAAKVESLVHSILYRERRRELLLSGACNGGKGCPTVHEEWFDVTLERLADVIERCKQWIRTWPYENGMLKPVWVEHIDKLYKASSALLLNDWQAWIDITTLAEGTIIQGTVPSDVKVKTGVIITTAEIKTEVDDSAVAYSQNLHQKLRSMSRQYNEKVVEIKAEATEEKVLSQLPAVPHELSLHVDDPFISSAVSTVPA